MPRMRRTKFVLVVGLESSGSKLAAKMIAMRFGPEQDVLEWTGHGMFMSQQGWGPEKTGTIVVHRSVPHSDFFPDVESALGQALCDGF